MQWWQIDLHIKCKLLYQCQDLWRITNVFLQLRNHKWLCTSVLMEKELTMWLISLIYVMVQH